MLLQEESQVQKPPISAGKHDFSCMVTSQAATAERQILRECNADDSNHADDPKETHEIQK